MKWNDTQRDRAREYISRVAAYQKQAGLSDAALIRQLPDLGSTRTWRQRLLAGDYEQLHPERTLHRLSRAVTVLDGGLPEAEFYPDLPFVREFASRLSLLERQTTDRRILVVLAPNGCGKTTCGRWAVAQNPAERAYCRLRPTWRNRSLYLANGLARALGAPTELPNAAAAEQRLVSLLSSQKRTMILDQAHEGGAALMHLLRVLVDETPSRFVYLGYDTAYRRVLAADTDALVEAQAFIGRCMRPIFDIYRNGIMPRDVAAFLRAAEGLDLTVANGLAHRLVTILGRHGNLRLLADAIAAARAESENDSASPDRIMAHVLGMAGLDPNTKTHNTEDENEKE